MAYQQCQSPESISKKSVIAMFPEQHRTRIYLESLDEDQWMPTSFDPKTREVCINIENEKLGLGGFNMTVTLPELTF